MQQVVIDCDPGYDDALALIFGSQYLDILGISTVAGNVALRDTTSNALAVADLLSLEADIFRGSDRPLQAKSNFADSIHGKGGLGGVELPQHSREISNQTAVEFLLDIPHKDLWVITLGPQTNIAQVLAKDPDWMSRIAGISMMGGSSRGGNMTAAAEFNVYFDPEAADKVVRAGRNIRMCGLNLTKQVQVNLEEVNTRYQASEPSKITTFCYQCLTGLLDNIKRELGSSRIAIHDTCAILAVTHPELIEFKKYPVYVELAGTHTRGMTLVDERLGLEPSENPLDVGVTIEAEASKDLLFNSFFHYSEVSEQTAS